MAVFSRKYVQGASRATARIGRLGWRMAVLFAGAVLALVIALASLAVLCVVWPILRMPGRPGASGGLRREKTSVVTPPVHETVL